MNTVEVDPSTLSSLMLLKLIFIKKQYFEISIKLFDFSMRNEIKDTQSLS